MSEKQGLLQRIRGNAEWDSIKWGVTTLAIGIYGIMQRFRHMPVDWMGLAILAALLGLIGALAWPSRKGRAASPVSLFSPLQVEAFQLARDLGEFAERTEHTRPAEPVYKTKQDVLAHTFGQAMWEWVNKMQTEYEEKFSPRILSFTRTLGYAGRHNARLQNYAEHVHDLDNVNTIRAQLWKEAMYTESIDFQGE